MLGNFSKPQLDNQELSYYWSIVSNESTLDSLKSKFDTALGGRELTN